MILKVPYNERITTAAEFVFGRGVLTMKLVTACMFVQFVLAMMYPHTAGAGQDINITLCNPAWDSIELHANRLPALHVSCQFANRRVNEYIGQFDTLSQVVIGL